MINQLQLMMLLPLTGAFIPEEIIDYLAGMDFFLIDFSFIPVKKLPFFTAVVSKFDTEQSNGYLDSIGLNSGSTLVNNLSLLATV